MKHTKNQRHTPEEIKKFIAQWTAAKKRVAWLKSSGISASTAYSWAAKYGGIKLEPRVRK